MRILMIAHTNAPWTPYYAGYFHQRGDRVLVVSFAPDPIDGVEMEFVGNEPFEKYGNKRLFLTRLPRIRRIVRRFEPDLVFAPYLISNGFVAVMSFRGPVIVSAVGTDVFSQSPDRRTWRTPLRERWIRFISRRATRVHLWSDDLADALRRLGVPAEKLVVFPLGADVERFRPHESMPRSDARQLICIRKHEPVYDIPTILDALAALRSGGQSFRCMFVGGGHLLDAHRRRAAELGILSRCEFMGHRPHEQLPALLAAADIYVSASVSDGTSSSLLEALAVGLFPVVSLIRANVPWVRDRENGLLFPVGRADLLAEALRTALNDRVLRERAFHQNRRLVDEKGNMARNLARLGELFDHVAAAPTGSSIRTRAAPARPG